MMWSIGGTMSDDRASFGNSIIKSQSKIKFPEAGSCFDYFFDPIKINWTNWQEKVAKYEPGVTETLF